MGRRWRNFGCAGSGFRTEGGDPGEKMLHIDASRDWGNNGTSLLWSKRRSQVIGSVPKRGEHENVQLYCS